MQDSDGRPRIRFGPKPHQTIPHEYAERMLTALAANSPAVFGKQLSRVVLEDLAPDGKTPAEGEQP